MKKFIYSLFHSVLGSIICLIAFIVGAYLFLMIIDLISKWIGG